MSKKLDFELGINVEQAGRRLVAGVARNAIFSK